MLANNNADNAPLLGGPTQALLADMLDYYVRHVTIAKGGTVQEINRANHYLAETELPELALWDNADGQKEELDITTLWALTMNATLQMPSIRQLCLSSM